MIQDEVKEAENSKKYVNIDLTKLADKNFNWNITEQEEKIASEIENSLDQVIEKKAEEEEEQEGKTKTKAKKYFKLLVKWTNKNVSAVLISSGVTLALVGLCKFFI